MTIWMTFIAIAVLLGVLSWWTLNHVRPDDRRRRDRDWGDWPSDQMGL